MMVMGGAWLMAAARVINASLWVSPWKLMTRGMYEDWAEMLLVAIFGALCITWGIMDRKSSQRFWIGVVAFALGVELAWNDGPIAHTVTDTALIIPRALLRVLH